MNTALLRTWSLAQRLTAMVLGFVLVTWMATVAVAWFVTEHELNELLDAHLAQTAALLATGEVDDDKDDAVVQASTQLHKYQSRVAFQIWHKGRLRARSNDAPDEPLAAADARGLSNQQVGGEAWRVFTTTRTDDGRVKAVIHVAEHASARHHVLLASLRGTMIPLLAALPLLAAGIWWSVRQALQPLRLLSDGVAARRPQALTPLAEEGVLPEARPLVQALNGLFERVHDQLASERRFTADAAHELRTPIAAIRMQAQVAQGATSDDERRAALDATIAGCDRATRLVEQLLQLARLEAEVIGASASESQRGQADLAAAAQQQAQELAAQAHRRRQRIVLDRPPQAVSVPMSAPLLAVLLRNLMDNALRYGPDGGRVQAQVAGVDDGTGARLVVEDAGPGLSDADLQRLGERFFRVLGSGQSGSGLGWSIVRRLARLHDLSIALDRSPTLGGLRVTVRWPVMA
ncbi:ATP-binding protein [Ottowia testudinis]|uniref:histidine kinase n=1 Tax=Ottowia testudinis TaxID=2816950 RepID=A0A975CH13_9BURK|nr:ATP-binding protein [Ottowia testudinis]QTD46283.1 sensor histidine kinase N-terminal domain-containing protein [Ottowia testudinis]